MMEAVTAKGGTATAGARSTATGGRQDRYGAAGRTRACGRYRKWATSFAGFAPADNPRFVTYVVLHDPTKVLRVVVPRRTGVPRRDELRAAEVRRPADGSEAARRTAHLVTQGQVGVTVPGAVASGPVSTPTAAGGAVAAIRPRHIVPVSLAERRPDRRSARSPPVSRVDVTGVSLDSRSVLPGDLYAALPGAVTHGAAFVANGAAGRGGRRTDRPDRRGAGHGDRPARCWSSTRPRDVLGAVAARIYGEPTRNCGCSA